MEQDGIHELTAAYALHALDREEEGEFEAHLAAARAAARISSPCRRRPASSLTRRRRWSHRPPARDRIIERAWRGAAASNVVTLPRRRLTPIRRAAAVAAAVAVGLGLWPPREGTRSTRSARLAVLADPAAQQILLQGAADAWSFPRGRARSSSAVSSLRPKTRPTRRGGSSKASAGISAARTPATCTYLTRCIPRGAIVAVTIERAGGVESPEGLPLHHRASRGREVAALQLSVCGSDACTTAGRHPAGAASASSASSRS